GTTHSHLTGSRTWRGDDDRIWEPALRLWAVAHLQRVPGEGHLLRRRRGPRAEPRGRQVDRARGPRALQPRMALGGGLAPRPRRGTEAHRAGGRVHPADLRAAACRLLPPVRAERAHPEADRRGRWLHLRLRRLRRRPALPRRGDRPTAPRGPLLARLQRLEVYPAAGLRRPVRLRR